jgi:predicted lipid-binding transport protein (Tim44 family)
MTGSIDVQFHRPAPRELAPLRGVSAENRVGCDGRPFVEAMMNEAADAGNLGTIVMLTFYWILIVMWDVVFPPKQSGSTPRSDASKHLDLTSARPALGHGRRTHMLRRSDPSFDEAAFLQGASRAYEMIVQAYAQGDAATLEPLVGEAVLDVFGRAAAERRERQETLELILVGIRQAETVDTGITGNTAEISVRFVAEFVSIARSVDGAIVDGDPQRILETEDLWTFARDLRSDAPAWRLIATESC